MIDYTDFNLVNPRKCFAKNCLMIIASTEIFCEEHIKYLEKIKPFDKNLLTQLKLKDFKKK